MPEQQWFVRTGETTHGPFSARQLKQLADGSKIRADTQIRSGPDGRWVSASKVKGLFAAPRPATELSIASQRVPEPIEPYLVPADSPPPNLVPSPPAPQVIRVPCPFCGEEIFRTAIKCRHCNEFLDGRPREQPQPAQQVVAMAPVTQPNVNVVVNQQTNVGGVLHRRWSPLLAMFLSFLIPGLGQLYKGQVINGLVWFVVVLIGYVALIIPGLVLHLCCIVGAGMGDPYR